MSVFTTIFSFDGLRLHHQLLQPCKIISENKACRRRTTKTRCPYYQCIIPRHFIKKKQRKLHTISGRASKRSSDSRTVATLCELVLQASVKVRCQNSRGWRASLCPRFAHSPRTALDLAYYQSWQTCLKVVRNTGTRFGKDNNNIIRHNPGNIGEVCYSCTYDSLLQEYPDYGTRYLGAHRQ